MHAQVDIKNIRLFFFPYRNVNNVINGVHGKTNATRN